jgi:hypothetical protein
MKNRLYYKKKAAILIAIYAFALLGVGTGSYVTMAWFTGQRKAEVNFASLKISEGFTVAVRYLSYNSHTDGSTTVYDGYKRNEITTLDTSFTYATNFVTVTDTSLNGPLGNHYFAPLYASTYCFEVTYDGGDMPFNVNLSAFTSPASSTQYSDTLSQYVSLSEAIDVYTGFSNGTNLDSDAKAFLEATSGDAVADRFNHTDGGGSSLVESWNTASTMTIPSGGKGYFFVTVYFSNDSSTFYSPVSGSANHWVRDTASGNSNPYQDLSITFTDIGLNKA